MGRDLTVDEFKELLAMEPDRGATNVRNVSSKHWQRWLSPEFRCVVPFNSFSEFNRDETSGLRPLPSIVAMPLAPKPTVSIMTAGDDRYEAVAVSPLGLTHREHVVG